MATRLDICGPEGLAGYVPRVSHVVPVCWVSIEEDGEICGHGCISAICGVLWAHDLKHWGKDKAAVSMLMQLFRRKFKGETVFTDVSAKEMKDMYLKMGFEEVSTVMRGVV